MPKRIGLLLSGCGALDGSDMHEAVLSLLALDRFGAEVVCTAPDMEQRHVLNHMSQEEMGVQRNVLLESARIARGNIIDLALLDGRDLDALIIPGGFGAIKNFNDFAFKGPTQDINRHVQLILESMRSLEKPIGAIAMAAVTVVIALAEHHPEVTIGTDKGVSAAIELMGGRHYCCEADQIYVDSAHKIVSTPANMMATGINEVAVGIERLVEKILHLIG